jgi:hypothetical protein
VSAADFRAALARAEQAAEGGSNDEEIDALREAVALAAQLLDSGPQWSIDLLSAAHTLTLATRSTHDVLTSQHRADFARCPCGPYRTIEQVKRANERAGQVWFSRETQSLWHCRIAPGVIAGRLFITSEALALHDTRRYTIRLATDDGHVVTVGEFQEFATLAAARKRARELTA